MSGIKTIALTGVGNLGQSFVDHLVSEQKAGKISKVIVLSRESSKGSETNSKLEAQGATIAFVDYDNQKSIESALTGVDAIISTLPVAGLLSQITIAKAAKAAGVKLFIPSEFGDPTEGEYPAGTLPALKVQVRKELKDIGIPYAWFYTGPFPDFCLTPYLGYDFAGGKIIIRGHGDGPVSWTARSDIARFVTYVITTHPIEKYAGRAIRIEGDRKTFNEIAAGYEKKTGKSLEITRVPRADVEKAVAENPNDFLAYLYYVWDAGKALSGKTEELDNDLYPGWNPKKVVDDVLP